MLASELLRQEPCLSCSTLQPHYCTQGQTIISRTGYIISRVQHKIKMQVLLSMRILRCWQLSIKPNVGCFWDCSCLTTQVTHPWSWLWLCALNISCMHKWLQQLHRLMIPNSLSSPYISAVFQSRNSHLPTDTSTWKFNGISDLHSVFQRSYSYSPKSAFPTFPISEDNTALLFA